MRNTFALAAISLFPNLALATTTNFLTIEGYSDGRLDNHPDWNGASSLNSMVDTSGTGTVTVQPFGNAVYLPTEPVVNLGDVFTTSIDFTFTGADTATAATGRFKAFLDAGFTSSDASGELVRVGFARNDLGYALHLQSNWRNNVVPPFQTGNPSVSGISATSVGINRDSDLDSDLLRLRLELTRGNDNDDWSLEATLFNVSGPAPVEVAELSVGGITFNTSSGTVAGTFGGGQGDSNARVSNRLIHSFTFDREINITPPPIATPPVATTAPADVNENGIPDIAELTTPLIAEFPPAEDTDGDGQSNVAELAAGTDPFNPSSTFGAADIAYTSDNPADQVDFTFASVPGIRYRIEVSKTLDPDDWNAVTNEFEASSALSTLTYDPAIFPGIDDRCFFRATILPSLDSDSDGLEDALELLIGSDVNSPSSVLSASSGGDYQQFFNLLQGASPTGGIFNGTNPGIPSNAQAARFLNQATFGATPQKIDQLRLLGDNAYEKWIDAQLASPSNNFASPYADVIAERRFSDFTIGMNAGSFDQFPHRVTRMSSFSDARENIQTVWTRLALFASDELRQRVAWGLSQIFVAGPTTIGHSRGQAEWYDTCIRNATGNYRTLLFEIAVNPWMGVYLSHEGNQSADPSINRLPDENFAREIMQLFSIGLFELNQDGTRRLDSDGNPIPTYDNDDITQLARVFTGLRRTFREFGSNAQDILSTAPMVMIESAHDRGDSTSELVYGVREKIFLQGPFYSPEPLPSFADDPGRIGMDDVNDTIDILYNHPNTPPFITKRLIQHLVTSNPSPAYVERIADVFVDNGSGVRGDLAAVVKAILLDEEARSASDMFADNSGRLKGPMLRLTNLCRIFEVGIDTPEINTLAGIQAWNPRLGVLQEDFKQAPHTYPSVFNFYRPEFSRPGEILEGGLVSPEFEILDSSSAITLPNRMWTILSNGHLHTPRAEAEAVTPNTDFDFLVMESVADDSNALLDELNILLCQGQLQASSRSQIAAAVDGAYSPTTANRVDRIRLATYLVTISHDGAILK